MLVEVDYIMRRIIRKLKIWKNCNGRNWCNHQKKPTNNHPLLDLPNVTVTAHLGAKHKSLKEKFQFNQQINTIGISTWNCLSKCLQISTNWWNKIPSFIKPYWLTQKMAFLLAQISKSDIRSITQLRASEVSEYFHSLQTFTTVGVLSAISGDEVNYTSAKLHIKERYRINYSEFSNHSGYSNKSIYKITTSNGVKTIWNSI